MTTLLLHSNICKTVVELSFSPLYCAFTFLCLGLCEEDHLFPTLHCLLPLQLSWLAGISCWRQMLVFSFCLMQFLKRREAIKRDIQLCLHFRKHIQKQWNILVRTRRWPLQARSFHCLFVSAKRTRSRCWHSLGVLRCILGSLVIRSLSKLHFKMQVTSLVIIYLDKYQMIFDQIKSDWSQIWQWSWLLLDDNYWICANFFLFSVSFFLFSKPRLIWKRRHGSKEKRWLAKQRQRTRERWKSHGSVGHFFLYHSI